jgi:hypothetical protein
MEFIEREDISTMQSQRTEEATARSTADFGDGDCIISREL